MPDNSTEIIQTLGIIVAWFILSRYLGEWITDNYYLLETISLLLIFGLLHEVWTSTGGQEDFVDFVIFLGDEIGRNTAQVFLLIGVSSLVLFSVMFRNWVEAQFGPFAVVQLIAFIAIISRMYIIVRATSNVLEIADGSRETYLIYTVGLLAIVFSFLLQDTYPPITSMHNAMVIFLSTILPVAYFYVLSDEEDFPSWEDIVKSPE